MIRSIKIKYSTGETDFFAADDETFTDNEIRKILCDKTPFSLNNDDGSLTVINPEHIVYIEASELTLDELMAPNEGLPS